MSLWVFKSVCFNTFFNVEQNNGNLGGKQQFTLLGFPDSGKGRKWAPWKIVHSCVVLVAVCSVSGRYVVADFGVM